MYKPLTNIQELELLSSLETRGVTPLKFAYMGDGYKTWNAIAEKSRKNHAVHYEEDLLKKEVLPFIFRDLRKDAKAVNIIDFGCGDGVPIVSVLKYAQEQGISMLRYIPVDISQNMLEQAQRTVKVVLHDIEIVPMESDFEKGEILEEVLSFTQNRDVQNYFFLLGNTLGNFENTEKVLANLKLSMFSNDSLTIGNEVSNMVATHKMLEYYNANEVFEHTTNTLRSYGMFCSKDNFNTRWNSEERQVEMSLGIEKEEHITIAGHTIRFEKGEEILLAVSKKFAEEDLVAIFSRVGFRLDLFTTNSKKDNSITSVTPTRYKSA